MEGVCGDLAYRVDPRVFPKGVRSVAANNDPEVLRQFLALPGTGSLGYSLEVVLDTARSLSPHLKVVFMVTEIPFVPHTLGTRMVCS